MCTARRPTCAAGLDDGAAESLWLLVQTARTTAADVATRTTFHRDGPMTSRRYGEQSAFPTAAHRHGRGAAANGGIAIGSVAGGVTLDVIGTRAVALTGLTIAVAAVLVAVLTRSLQPLAADRSIAPPRPRAGDGVTRPGVCSDAMIDGSRHLVAISDRLAP